MDRFWSICVEAAMPWRWGRRRPLATRGTRSALIRSLFERDRTRWDLDPDSGQIPPPTACLLPGRQDGKPAMLKRSCDARERLGGVRMAWGDGGGAARVFADAGDAVLMQRAGG